jgi:hypothetical protein
MDRAEFLFSLFAPLPAQLEQDAAGDAPASSPEFGSVCVAFLGGRCSRDEVLRAAVCRMRREFPADLLELVHSAN